MMESFGAMWLDSSRPRHGRQALSIELLYTDGGSAAIDGLARRVSELLDAGVKVLVRVDVRPGQTIPAEGDFEGKWFYANYFRQLAAHPQLSRVHGFIVGNEPNLRAENTAGGRGISAEWYMRVHSGANSKTDDAADAWTQLRAGGYTGDVLIAAVAPWSPESDGTLEFYPTPRGATGTMPWLRYAATMYWLAYSRSRMPRREVKGTIHTYSNVLLCKTLGLDPAREPTYADALRQPEWNNCQYGIRVYEEFRQQMEEQAGAAVPHYVTEWNSLVGRQSDALTDAAWPCNNYPDGLVRHAVDYMAAQDSLLGFAVFIDDDPSGSWPFWGACATKGHLNTTQLDPAQRARLQRWDADMRLVFEHGW